MLQNGNQICQGTQAGSTLPEQTLFWKEWSNINEQYYKVDASQQAYEYVESLRKEFRTKTDLFEKLLQRAFNHIEELQKQVANLSGDKEANQ